ncbi:MAG: hypothetical protein R2939_08870 [Kofleriaceae bacterium]
MKRTRQPRHPGHRARTGEADVLVAVRVDGLAEQRDLAKLAATAVTWRRISRAAPRSRPRVNGTTQNVQNLSQLRWMVTKFDTPSLPGAPSRPS